MVGLAAIQLSSGAVSALRIAGPAFFLGLQGASINTARGIVARQELGGLSPLPFLSLFTNCIVWGLYGFLKKDNTVLIPNCIGVLSGASCCIAYQRQAKREAKSFPTGLYAAASVVVLMASLLALQGNHQWIGSIGCGLAVLVMGSPLATLSTVIKSKSTATLPFATSFMGFCNSLSWSAYGLLVANDVMIYGPNLVGLLLSSIQMALFGLFGLPPAKLPLGGKVANKPLF